MNNDFKVADKMYAVEEVLALLLMKASCRQKTESINVSKALGRVLAVDVISSVNIPPQDNTAMDGYALNHKQGTGRFVLSQRIPAGAVPKPLEHNTVARIFTGAFIPEGADAVVMQEACRSVGDNEVEITLPAHSGQYIRRQGEDVKTGDVVLKKGQRIRPQDMGMMASVGLKEIMVYQPLKVAIFSTGDEIVEPGLALKAGQIYNSNRYVLQGLLQTMAVEVIDLGVVKDSLEQTKEALRTASQRADVILTTGGVSVGEEDHIKTAVSDLGELMFYKVKMKPGKPFTFGKVDEAYFLGLPGNPVSTFVVFNVFVRPFLSALMGSSYGLATQTVVADFDWSEKGLRREYVRVRLSEGKAHLYQTQSSGALSSTVWADGLVCIKENSVVNQGDRVEFIAFNQWGC